jgi:hypothetical protein
MLGSLQKTIEFDNEKPGQFFERHPDLYPVLDGMLISARGLLMQTVEHLPADECSTSRYMLWRTLYDYTEQALLLIIKSRLDEGYALLRMASELARDIARLSESPHNYEMWKSKPKNHLKDDYKKAFKFKRDNITEKSVYDLYNFTSIYGVHGHQTRDAHMSHLGVVVHDRFVKFNVSESAVLQALIPWLAAFFSLHLMAAKSFEDTYSKINPNPLGFFIKMQLDFSPVVEDIVKNIKEYYPK